MKSRLILFLILFAFPSFAQTSTIIGTWEMIDEGEAVYIEFYENGYAVFEDAQGEYGGEPSYDELGILSSISYSVNYSTQPFTIEFIHKETIEEMETVNSIYGVFQFLDGGKQLRICLNTEEEIITEFDDEDTVIFTRIE